MRRRGTILVVLLLAARALAVPAGDEKLAAAHYRQGEAYKRVRLYDDAIAEYQKAYSLVPNPLLLYNIAATFDLADDRQHALEYFRKYVAAEPNGRQARAARARAEELERDLARTGRTREPETAPPPAKTCDSLQECADQCIAKIPLACAEAGRLSAATGGAGDLARAVGFYVEACDGHMAEACLQAGQIEESGQGVPKSYGEALRLYTAACALGSSDGCGRVGWFHAKGLGAPRNLVRAAEFFRRACDGAEMQGCYGLATLYAGGDPMPADPERAATLFGQACDAGLGSACRDLAQLVAAGTPRHPADRGRALVLDERACGLGDGASCAAAARLDPKQAARMVLRACELKHAEACRDLDAGLPAIEDEGQLETACAAGAGAVCGRLGDRRTRGTGVAVDKAEAARLHELGCAARHTRSCRAAAELYLAGAGLARDPVKGLALHVRACEGGLGESCVQAAKLYREAGDLEAAKSQLNRACRLGILDACKD